ncbi:sensor histidine kinase [Sphingomonas hengshuiensis]|uniref:sensor histidine kinase n=1 Tax=Sphingomonas hengshuiensis TaxID=1609977 RepID=UPI00138E25A6|nr:sensor histidine kinase [Sphingomonas hengshuiensis]
MNAATFRSPPRIGFPVTGLLSGLSAHGTSIWRARAKFALLILLAWTAVSIFQAIPDMVDGFLRSELIAKVLDAWAWALLTPLILLIDRRLTAAYPNLLRIAAAHLLLSVPFSLAHICVMGAMFFPFPEVTWNPLRVPQFAIYFYMGGWVTYCAFVGAVQAFNFHRRLLTSQVELERVEKRLVKSRLNALRLQLEPHFLFNTLNAISGELGANPKQAREMIEDLGALLRRSLDCQGSTEITLAQELALLDHYLAIQRLRFGERIRIRIKADPAALSAMVPSMLLQPLVENAIRHGLEGRVHGGEVVISAHLAGDHLQIKVDDDGVGLPPHWRMETGAGLGLHVTHERVQALCDDEKQRAFTLSRRRGGGTRVAIRIPTNARDAEAGDSAA